MDSRIAFIPAKPQRLNGAGYLLGFALGGFFDGILLHQILQWHHLLGGLERAPFSDLRVQILADGVFHALMYIIAGVGLIKLLRARYALMDRSNDRLLAAAVLIGFGAWHVIDSVLSHWVLGIHRIRMDVPNPLFWDLVWFFLFGVLFVLAGLLLRNRPPPDRGSDARSGKSNSTLVPLLLAAVPAAGIVALLPPADVAARNTVTVLLRPDATPAQLLAGLQRVDGRLLWNDSKGTVWVFVMDKDARPSKLYSHGALFVSGTLLPAGCSAVLRT